MYFIVRIHWLLLFVILQYTGIYPVDILIAGSIVPSFVTNGQSSCPSVLVSSPIFLASAHLPFLSLKLINKSPWVYPPLLTEVKIIYDSSGAINTSASYSGGFMF